MQFTYHLPWWLGLLLAAAIAGLTYAQYHRPLRSLTRVERAVLAGIRLFALSVLVLFVLRPIVLLPPLSARRAVVPVLVDVSRSMRLNDADGQTRIGRAKEILRNQLLSALSARFDPELYAVGEHLEPLDNAPAALDRLSADAHHSELGRALEAVRDRYRGRQVAGIILLTDGADTGSPDSGATWAADPPVFAVGLGSPGDLRDREVTGVTAGEQRLDQSSVDLRVSATTSGYGASPFVLRVLANGRELESRRVAPRAGTASIEEVFTVSPDPASPTVYTAQIPSDDTELVAENNVRSVLVNPIGRTRRLLIVEGAPGFDHSFMTRAWQRDPGLEVDAVGRQGKDADGNDTFFVHAGATRAAALAHGFPSNRQDLYAYDALVMANVEAGFFTQTQLAMAADFVGERGGGLLVVGGRSFARDGLAGTPLEHVLPVELDDRRGGLPAASGGGQRTAAPNKVVITAEGESHSAMRIGESLEATRRLWSAFPALAALAPLGGPRPGADVLAVASAPTGSVYPVIAAQRYGRGRSMIFAGDASWRWRMMLPSTDRSYEYFWRQAARFVAGSSPDPVAISAPDAPETGDVLSIGVDVRDAGFAPVGDATISATATAPGGATVPLMLHRAEAGRYTADLRADQPGLYRVDVDARRGSTPLGAAVRWLYVGGVDREFADPRLNEPWLRRVARRTGGRYVGSGDASRIAEWLQEEAGQPAALEHRDLWHAPWAFVLVAGLLSAEWILRRRWGLR